MLIILPIQASNNYRIAEEMKIRSYRLKYVHLRRSELPFFTGRLVRLLVQKLYHNK